MIGNTITLADLLNMINEQPMNTVEEPWQRRPVKPRSYEPEKETKPTSVGSVYNEDALNEALRLNANETVELQRQLDAKNREAEALRLKINNLKNQTKMVKNGTNVAVTMSRDELTKLMETLGNTLANSEADRLTFTLENVG